MREMGPTINVIVNPLTDASYASQSQDWYIRVERIILAGDWLIVYLLPVCKKVEVRRGLVKWPQNLG